MLRKKAIVLCLLCFTVLMLCGTAFADNVSVSEADASVKISTTQKEGDTVFTVTKESGVSEGQLYLILLQQGTSADGKPAKPTKENVYYLDCEQAAGTSISFQVYPKTMDEGDYTVFLSDYSSGNDGAVKSVGTITYGLENTYECGDVNHSGGKPDNRDVRDLARYVGEWEDYLPGGSKEIDVSLGDVNGSGGLPDNRDVRDLARYVGEWADYPSLPHQK